MMMLASALPAMYQIGRRSPLKTQTNKNILVVVFDTWTAKNINLFGYDRSTMPILSQIAEHAIVYHQHRAGGNYTTPGTASLLSGTYPWTHRAMRLSTEVEESRAAHNIFAAFEGYHRIAHTQNPVADVLLTQFKQDIDDLIPVGEYFFEKEPFFQKFFPNDKKIASLSRSLSLDVIDGKANTLFLPVIFDEIRKRRDERVNQEYGGMFPLGTPALSRNNFFTLEDGMDGVIDKVSQAPRPYLGYFHFFPPHAPYRPRVDVFDKFGTDNLYIPQKPEHLASKGVSFNTNYYYRQRYDEYLGYVDSEFGRLINALAAQGELDNTIVVLTADHGEMFERGIRGHFTAAMHEPLLRIPLLIFDPDLSGRIDIHSPTSAIDVLPTLLHLANKPVPDWIEGQLLRPYQSGPPKLNRRIFSVEAKHNSPSKPLERATIAMLRWPYKIIYSIGYEEIRGGLGNDVEYIEIYNVELDPEELFNLAESDKALTEDLRTEVVAYLTRENMRYEEVDY